MSAAREGRLGPDAVERVPLDQRVAFTVSLLARRRRERRLPFAPLERITELQRARLGEIVAHARARVPYYRETMRRLGLSPGDISSAEDLAKLPLIEREQLQRDPEYFASQERDRARSLARRSGGSSSTPVTVFSDPTDMLERSLAIARVTPVIRRLTGRRWHRRVLWIQPPGSSGAMIVRARRRNLVVRRDPRLTEMTVSLFDDVAENLEVMNEFRPHVLSVLGSYAEELFAHAVRSGRPFHRPDVLVYGADALPEGARKMLGREGIEVVSVYQAIESAQIGFECESHRGHHLNIDLCPVRIVDADGRQLPPGKPGEVVISNLINRATVLLNYRLGDIAAEIPDPCDCGRSLPLLSMVEGRAHEWLTASDGRRLHSQILIRPFSLDADVWGYRITQTEPGKFGAEVLAVPGSDPEQVASRVRERFAAIVGPEESVEIAFVDSLPRTAAGKVLRAGVVSPRDGSGSPSPAAPPGSA